MATTNHLVSPALLLLLALLGASVRRAGATTFEVGGEHGWAVPPAKDAGVYNDWASKNRFLVGDSVRKITRSIDQSPFRIILSAMNRESDFISSGDIHRFVHAT